MKVDRREFLEIGATTLAGASLTGPAAPAAALSAATNLSAGALELLELFGYCSVNIFPQLDAIKTLSKEVASAAACTKKGEYPSRLSLLNEEAFELLLEMKSRWGQTNHSFSWDPRACDEILMLMNRGKRELEQEFAQMALSSDEIELPSTLQVLADAFNSLDNIESLFDEALNDWDDHGDSEVLRDSMIRIVRSELLDPMAAIFRERQMLKEIGCDSSMRGMSVGYDLLRDSLRDGFDAASSNAWFQAREFARRLPQFNTHAMSLMSFDEKELLGPALDLEQLYYKQHFGRKEPEAKQIGYGLPALPSAERQLATLLADYAQSSVVFIERTVWRGDTLSAWVRSNEELFERIPEELYRVLDRKFPSTQGLIVIPAKISEDDLHGRLSIAGQNAGREFLDPLAHSL